MRITLPTLARRVVGEPHGLTAGVSRELARLDPFSFFVLPGARFGAEHVVVGATGTFAVVVGSRGIDGHIRRDVAAARHAAKRVRRMAGETAVHTPIVALLCLPGRQFRPKTRRGVRVIPWGLMVTEIAERHRKVTLHQSRRVAQALHPAEGR